MSSLSNSELEARLREAGNKLLALESCITTEVQELLPILDELDGLLSKVEQEPSRSMQDALYLSMKALISNQFLKHTDVDVKVSVASCMSELTRITAPDAPFDDVQMKDIFQLTVIALGMLSNKDSRGYTKALRILDNIVKVKACLLMLDLECDGLISDMFKQLLSTIRYISLPVVFKQMEFIMTLTLEESEVIPEEFLSTILTSVCKKKENVLSRSWRLGENVLRNCAVKLQRYLPKVVQSRNLSFDDYSIVVASICQNSPKDEHVVAVETVPCATEPSETIMDDSTGQKMTNGTLKGGNSLRTLEHCHLDKQQGNAEARRHLQAENSDVKGTVQEKAATIPKKRGRKPKSQQKPEESRLRQEERVTDSCIMPLRPLHMDVSKEERDDSREYIEKDSGIPHGINLFGEKLFGEKLVGHRVKVWWPLDKMFYEGAVASFDSSRQTHKVLYADGDEETLNLRSECWELLEEPNMEHSSPAAASHKSLKKKAKTKSASSAKQQGTKTKSASSAKEQGTKTKSVSSAKQQGTLSRSKWQFADKPKAEAPKSGSSEIDFAPEAATDDFSKVYATFEDDKQKSSGETDDSKPDVVSIAADVANSTTVNPNSVNAKHKLNGEEESKTPTIIRKPQPCSIVEHGDEISVHTKITMNDKLPCEKLNEDGEMRMLPESVDAQGSD